MRALDYLLDLHSMVKSHANNRYKKRQYSQVFYAYIDKEDVFYRRQDISNDNFTIGGLPPPPSSLYFTISTNHL